MRRMIFLITMLVVVGLMGCNKVEELPDQFNEEEVIKAARQVVDMVNVKEYDKLVDEQFNAIMKANLTADKLKTEIEPIVEELGAFQKFDKETVVGNTDKDTEEEMAVAVLIVKYETRKAQYTITFDNNMKVGGFYIK